VIEGDFVVSVVIVGFRLGVLGDVDVSRRGRLGYGTCGSGNLDGARAEVSVPECHGTVAGGVAAGFMLLSLASCMLTKFVSRTFSGPVRARW